MANPQDYQLAYTPSGLPVLEGPESVRALTPEQAKQRLNELLMQRGQQAAGQEVTPLASVPKPPRERRPTSRPIMPAVPPVPPPSVGPVQAIPEALRPAVGAIADSQVPQAISSVLPAQGPLASVLTQQTPLASPPPPGPEPVSIPEEEITQALEGVEGAEDLPEESRLFEYFNRTQTPPSGWDPTPRQVKSLIEEGLLTETDVQGPGTGKRQIIWDALRAQQTERLSVPYRLQALSDAQQRALAPGEREARQRLFRRGLSFSELGSSIDWYSSLNTLKEEYRIVLNEERLDAGKGPIQTASPEEQEEFNQNVAYRAAQTLQNLAASSGLSVSDVNNPEIQENIEWWWAAFEPFRAIMSPVTFFEPLPGGGLAVTPEQAVFNVGEARYIPQAQEAYGNLQKFGMLASTVMVPLSGMMESGESWNDPQTLAVIREGRADPFDHLDKWGFLLTGDEDNRANKILGTAVLTAGLLFEPEPFTTLLALPSAGRKAMAFAARSRNLERPARVLERELPAALEGRNTVTEFLEGVAESGERALANFLRTTGQQAVGVQGSTLTAFSKFDRQIELLRIKAQKSQRAFMAASREAATKADVAALATLRLKAAEDAANLAYAEMMLNRSMLDATLELRGFSPEEAARVVDPKDVKKAKYTADSRLEDTLRRRSRELERAANKAQKEYEAALRSLNRENVQVGRVLQDILGTEVPAAGRTASGRVSARWYPITVTDASGSVRLADSVPTVRGEDIVAVWDDSTGKWADPTAINPARVYGGKRGGPLQIEDVSVGTGAQRRRPAGSINLPETSNRKYDVWFDVRDASGNRYRVRHPVSRSSWKREDVRAFSREGFGVTIDQARALDTAARLRDEKLQAFRPVAAAFDTAKARRKAFLVLQKEAEEGVAATARINAWRKARNKYDSAEKSRKAAEKSAKGLGRPAKASAQRIRSQIIKFAEREKGVAAAEAQREVVLNMAGKLQIGLGELQKFLNQRTGGILGSVFKRSLNDIVDYKKLRPEEIRGAVQDIVTKSIKDTEGGAGVIGSSKFKTRLLSQYLKAPGATKETAELALDLLKNRSAAAKKVLDAAESGKSISLTADEIAELQAATGEFITKTWKQRVSSGPIGYASVLEKEREYYSRINAKTFQEEVKNWFMRRALSKTKDPLTVARGLKMRELGVVDDEIADVYIAASNVYDLGMDELLAVTQFGKMPEGKATERMIKLMDNEEELVLRTTASKVTPEKIVSEQKQQFEALLGLESRFIGAKASLLDDLRVVPEKGLSDKAFYNKRLEIAKSLGVSVDEIDPALVHRALDEGATDEFSRALESVAYAFYPPALNTERGTGGRLKYAAMEILRGKRTADGAFEGGAKTFREFSTRMIAATYRITGGKDETARAFAYAATGFTGAAVSGYTKQLAARVTYAPITPDQALAINRLLIGNPQSAVDFAKRGREAFALTEKQIDEGIEALAQLGLPLSERGVRTWQSQVGLREEVSKTVKELVKVGSDPSANPYAIRGLLEKLDSLTEGSTKKLVGFNPVKPELNTLTAMWAKTANSYDFLSAAWRTSLTTGILYPNPAYWANNVIGDFSQIWFEAGLARATRLSFNNFLNNVPYWGRGLAERQAQMQAWAAKKGKDALPSPLEAFANPYLGKLLKGEDFTVVAKDGTRIRGRDLMREGIEDGIYATQVNQELFTLFKKELGAQGWAKGLGAKAKDIFKGDVRRAQEIADHANIVQQRQRMALYADFRMQGLSRQEARLRTLDALYDWKDGVSAVEINTFVRMSPFYRFWKLGLRQMTGAFLEPVTKPLTSQLVKSMYGQTKIARTKQQIMLFGGMPEIFGHSDMESANSEASIMADFYAFRYPEYLNSKIVGTFSAMPTDKNWRDWYIRETGVNYDSIARIWPTATILDTTDLVLSFLQGAYHVQSKMTGTKPFGEAPPNWKSHAVEPWVEQLNPIAQELTRGVLARAGVPTEYYSSNGQIRLSLGNQEVALGVDQALGWIGLGLPISDEPDPNSGKYTMDRTAYRLMELIGAPTGGLLTQVPRYIKAAKNPAWEDSYVGGASWFLQSLFRTGAPTPYAGQRNIQGDIRDFEEAWKERETAGVLDLFEDPRDPRLR